MMPMISDVFARASHLQEISCQMFKPILIRAERDVPRCVRLDFLPNPAETFVSI